MPNPIPFQKIVGGYIIGGLVIITSLRGFEFMQILVEHAGQLIPSWQLRWPERIDVPTKAERENARQTVRHDLRNVLDMLVGSPITSEIGYHFDDHIDTGLNCVYQP